MHSGDKTLVVVRGGADLHAMIRLAAERAFPAATVVIVNGIHQVRDTLPSGPIDLLVLVDPDPSEEGRLLEFVGLESGKCPCVRLGAAGRDDVAEIIPPDEWGVPLLSRVFRSVVAEHGLRRNCARAQGDLLTLGRRINHDLRTPLGAIMVSADALQEVLAEAHPSLAELVRPISESSNDLKRIIERVGMVVNASASPPARVQWPMGRAVLAALERLEGRLRASRASVHQPETWPSVNGVASWLEVVWSNLVGNSIQHAGAAPRIDVGWDRGEHEYRFWVRDNGPGIPPERRKKLFQPFHRLHELDSARGLGLPIVGRLVELMGGRCSFDSPSDGGSRFSFTLPHSGLQESRPE